MGQVSEVYGVLGASIALAIFTYNMLFRPTTVKPVDPNDWDMIPVGTSYAIAKNTHKPLPKSSHKAKAKTKPVAKMPSNPPKPKSDESSLYNDCVSALVGLGEKKSRARMIAAKTMATHDPKTLDEFIKAVMK